MNPNAGLVQSNHGLWYPRTANPARAPYWDGRIPVGTDVNHSNETLANYSFVQEGLTNPANTTNPRVSAVVPPTPKVGPGKSGSNALKYLTYNTDTNNKNGGQQSNPAASTNSLKILGKYTGQTPDPVNPSNYYVGVSIFLPDGTARGDNAFPLVPTFYQLLEDFGPPSSSSPEWQLNLLNIGGVNKLCITTQMSPGFPRLWQDTVGVTYEAYVDIVFHCGRSLAASTDGGMSGGFLEGWIGWAGGAYSPLIFVNPLSTSAKWTLANGRTKALFATMNSGYAGGNGWVDFDQYRTANQFPGESAGVNAAGIDPVCHYEWGMRIGPTFASVDPRL